MQQIVKIIGLVVPVFFVFNALGSIPMFIAVLAHFDHKHQKKIIIRELLISLGILLIFTFFGKEVLMALQISQPIIGIAGGILLFIVSLELIFPKITVDKSVISRREPFIVPLAVPALAGPGSIAIMMLFSSQYGPITTSLALMIAWIPSFILIYSSSYIKKFLKDKGLIALERLGGMILFLIGVQMLAKGAIEFVKANF